jgi:hypothetical protein
MSYYIIFFSLKFISSFAIILLPYVLLLLRLVYSIKGIEEVPLTLRLNVAISLLYIVVVSLLIRRYLIYSVNYIRTYKYKEVDFKK